MPTYDYRCNACGHEFELFQSMSASPKRKCQECKAMKLERLIGTGAAVLFKGSGFYETDYRSDGYKKAAKAESDAAKPKDDTSKGAKSGDAKPTGDTKPDGKAPAKPDPKKPGAKPKPSGSKAKSA
ncbi:MAG: zinc ribbon domain-containing protein [Planctomycetota bacterium]